MNLEEKLQLLGYHKYKNYFRKKVNERVDIQFVVKDQKYTYAVRCWLIETQEDIDYIQIAFNRLKRDLKEITKEGN